MRIRTIKPDFFTHERLFDAEREAGLPLRLAFVGLWCAADREGRFRWEPRRLGVQILPYDQVDFSRVLDALFTRGFIIKYASPEGVFGYIPSFSKHQVINNREAESQLPDPPPQTTETPENPPKPDACPTRDSRDEHASKAEGKGKEGKGKEGKEGEQRPQVARFAPPTREELDLMAAKIGLPAIEVDKFVHYYGSNGWRVGKSPMKSWPHALGGWAARWRDNPRPGRHNVPAPKTPDECPF